jgi:5-methylcytosine-specific restriction enzyme A
VSQWSSSTRRDRLPAGWNQIRRSILKRDNWRCQVRKEDGRPCGDHATEVDHIKPGDDHRPENLQAICSWHHQRKSSREGGQANAAKRRANANRFRRTEEHPGLL